MRSFWNCTRVAPPARKRISTEDRERLEWDGIDRDFDPEYLDIEECQEIVEAFNCD